MKILVISNNYPSDQSPNSGVFVYNLLQEFAKEGHEITVIAVRGLLNLKGTEEFKSSYGNERAKVFRPGFISTSAKKILGFNTYAIGEYLQVRAIRNTIIKNKLEFDVVYAHFISNALIAVRAVAGMGKPVFAAIGESNIDNRRALYTDTYFQKHVHKIAGFVAVSPKLRDKLVGFGVSPDRIVIHPNAVDLKRFYPRDKSEMRQKYKLPQNKKLAIFVGRFMHHKGPLRVLKAAEGLNVGIIFIGSGPQNPEGKQVVFNGRLPSEQVPELLSAADLFVLPTLQEGSCNSIAEAIACGLPVVSSDIPEVRVQCKPSFSILVNPMDVNQLHKAIEGILTSESSLQEMSAAALEEAQNLDIRQRAKRILKFISPKSGV